MKHNSDSVSFVGLGYVGLCSAVVFAAKGIETLGIDIDPEKVESILKGRPSIHEPLLRKTLKAALKKGSFSATTEMAEVADTGITFLTVGTPSRPDGSINLTYVKKATERLGRAIADKETYHLEVVKSTVTPGTTTTFIQPVLEAVTRKSVGADLGLASNPEFLKEGSAIGDTLHPDKVVIGTRDKKSAAVLKRLYHRLYRADLPPVIETSPETAELIKYASNSFLATKVSFINTIANIAQQIPGVDVDTVAKTIGRDPRIGSLFLNAGPGYGGSCFHKDIQALIRFSKGNGYDPVLLRATEQTNEQQADRVVALTEKLVGSLAGRRVAILGLSFKKGTDDIREAASLRVIERLGKKGARVVAYDPKAVSNAKKVLGDSIEYAVDTRSALKGADCCLIMTEWDEFLKLGPNDYRTLMRKPRIVDARRIFDHSNSSHLSYVAIGVGPNRTK